MGGRVAYARVGSSVVNRHTAGDVGSGLEDGSSRGMC
jgi:hypothetical protein